MKPRETVSEFWRLLRYVVHTGHSLMAGVAALALVGSPGPNRADDHALARRV